MAEQFICCRCRSSGNPVRNPDQTKAKCLNIGCGHEPCEKCTAYDG